MKGRRAVVEERRGRHFRRNLVRVVEVVEEGRQLKAEQRLWALRHPTGLA